MFGAKLAGVGSNKAENVPCEEVKPETPKAAPKAEAPKINAEQLAKISSTVKKTQQKPSDRKLPWE
jgi:hypothetical protein